MMTVETFEVKESEPWCREKFPQVGHYWCLMEDGQMLTDPVGPFGTTAMAHYDAYIAGSEAA